MPDRSCASFDEAVGWQPLVKYVWKEGKKIWKQEAELHPTCMARPKIEPVHERKPVDGLCYFRIKNKEEGKKYTFPEDVACHVHAYRVAISGFSMPECFEWNGAYKISGQCFLDSPREKRIDPTGGICYMARSNVDLSKVDFGNEKLKELFTRVL